MQLNLVPGKSKKRSRKVPVLNDKNLFTVNKKDTSAKVLEIILAFILTY